MAVSSFPPPPESIRNDPAVLQWLVALVAQTVSNSALATTTTAGLVRQGVAVADAAASSVAVTAADATVSAVSVDSANATDLATVITLANELKGDVNTLVSDVNPSATLSTELKGDLTQLVTDVNAIKDQLNALLAGDRASGQILT